MRQYDVRNEALENKIRVRVMTGPLSNLVEKASESESAKYHFDLFSREDRILTGMLTKLFDKGVVRNISRI